MGFWGAAGRADFGINQQTDLGANPALVFVDSAVVLSLGQPLFSSLVGTMRRVLGQNTDVPVPQGVTPGITERPSPF